MGKSQEIKFLSYKGVVLYDTIGDLIGELKQSMFEAKVKQSVYKRVLMIMIEALENILKYHEYFDNKENVLLNYPPSINIFRNSEGFIVRCSNPVLKEHSIKLKIRLDHINRLDRSGIKKEYKKIITNGQFSEKGGAGLGLVEMAKISDDKLGYSFEAINLDFDYYTLALKVKL